MRCASTTSSWSGRNVSSPTCNVTLSTSSAARRSGVKCRPAVGAAAEPALTRIDGLVALGVAERLGDVRRQRHRPVRLPRRAARASDRRPDARAARPHRDGRRRAASASGAQAPPRHRRRPARAAAPRRADARSGCAPGRPACRSRPRGRRSAPGSSRNTWCDTSPVARRKTSSRDSSRRAAGCCAISSSGRS